MYSNVDIYIETIEWKKRLKNEIPFLKSIIELLIEEKRTKNLKILDLGCGPGIQLLELAKEYPHYNFVGLDIDEEMINYAKQETITKGLNIEYRQGNFLNDTNLISGPFDFIFSLGNSLSLIQGTKNEIGEVLKPISKQLNNNGYLFFQILNNDNPRQGYKISKIKKLNNNDEFFTLKRFEPNFLERIMKVDFLDLYRKNGVNEFNQNISTNFWKMNSVENLFFELNKKDLKLVNAWENYKKSQFNSKNSDNLLCLSKKIKQ